MDQKRWMQVNWLFHEALELTGAARTAYLHRTTTDEAVAAEVNRLLRLHETAGDFLETSESREAPETIEPEHSTFSAGDVIDRFRLLSRSGTGGMGEVWLAERSDRLFEQRVALKIIKSTHSSSMLLRRFTDERQTLARLEHPFITRLIDGGTTTNGRPYLVMEWVDGVCIDRYCREQALDTRAILRLFLLVCEAVQFAHQHLVIHRDIKPGNVLVSMDGRPKLLDFGIADLIESDHVSEPESMRGLTPEYASPEQLRGATCTTSSDVYSLGVLLRRLVNPQESHKHAGLITQLAAVQGEGSIIALHTPAPRQFGDLDIIIAKAVSLDPRGRYQTVQDFSDDIDRCLKKLPVAARGAKLGYRVRRFAVRNAAYCAAAIVALVVLIFSAIITYRGAQRTRQERDTALAATRFLEEVLSSASPFQLGHDPTVADLLGKTSEQATSALTDRPEVEYRVRMTLVRANISLWNWDAVLSESSRALELARDVYGFESAETAECLSVVGRAQTWLRKETAVATQEQALTIRRKLFHTQHPAVAETLINLGFATWWTARPPRFDDADALYREGIAAYRQGGSTNSPDYARAQFSYANFLEERGGRRIEALHSVREAVACFEHLRQPPDRYSTSALFLYGSLLIDEGQAAAGLEILRTFVLQVPMSLSKDVLLHISYGRIGFVELLKGNQRAAFDAFRQGIELDCRWRAAHGHDPELWNSLADNVRNAVTADLLVAVVGNILVEFEPSAQTGDMHFLERLLSITTLTAMTDDHASLARLAQSIRDTSQRLFPRSSMIPDGTLAVFGHLSLIDGNTEEAEKLSDQAFKSLRARRGQFHPFTQFALMDLIQLAELRGDEAAADELRSQLTSLETNHRE